VGGGGGAEGFGSISEGWLLKCVRAVRGDDLSIPASRDLGAYVRQLEPVGAALVRTVGFLREAGLPHLSLLPYRFPLLVLARFFHLHPEPTRRSRALLVRWFWWGSWNGRFRDTQNQHLRWVRTALPEGGAEAGVVSALLEDVVDTPLPSRADLAARFRRPWSFNAVDSKLAGIVLAHQPPLDLRTGDRVSVPDLAEALGGARAFLALDPGGSLAGQILHPYDVDLGLLLLRAGPEALASHLLPGPVPVAEEDAEEAPPLPPSWIEARLDLLVDASLRVMDRLVEPAAPRHGDWTLDVAALGDEPEDTP